MSTTLATDKQAEAIKRRMSEIRTELPSRVDDARLRAQQLTDWKYHLSRHPLPVLAAAAVAGYLLVPAKRSRDQVVTHREHTANAPTAPAQRGMLGGMAGAVATIAARQAVSLAASHVSKVLSEGKNQ